MELTKQTQIFATNIGSWVIPGALCAALYLAMSLPLSALARRLEERWKASDAMTRRARRGRRCATCTCGAARGHVLRGVTFDVAARRDRGVDGRLGLGEDDDAARDRRAGAVRRAARSPSTASRSRRGRRPAGDCGGCARQGRHGLPVSLSVRAPVGAAERLARAGARPAGRRGRRRRRARWSCCERSASSIARRRCRASCRAARRSGWPSRARWPSIRRCC